MDWGFNGGIWVLDNDAVLSFLLQAPQTTSGMATQASRGIIISLSSPRPPNTSCRARYLCIRLFMMGIGLRQQFSEVPNRGDAG